MTDNPIARLLERVLRAMVRHPDDVELRDQAARLFELEAETEGESRDEPVQDK